MGQAGEPWHGYVNQLTYGLNLRIPVGDDVVERIAVELLRQRIFVSRVERYYDAAVAALRSGERIDVRHADYQDERNVRDLLTRLVQRLDELRPWPEHPFYEIGPHERDTWNEPIDAPVIARVPRSPMDIMRHLHRAFRANQIDGATTYVMVLRLRTGQLVALRSAAGYTKPGVDLLTHADPEQTAAAFRELTGLDTEPPVSSTADRDRTD